MKLLESELDELIAGLREVNKDFERMIAETDVILKAGKKPRRYNTRETDEGSSNNVQD